jgi:DNA-binding transcriptional ArsR family regulator
LKGDRTVPADGRDPPPRPPVPTDPEAVLEEAGRAAEFLKALGHDGRLLMLVHLCRRDHSVTELEQLTHSRQAAVSQQLARLRYERLVSTRREGNQIIYSLSDERVRAVIALMGRLFALPVDRTED